jgi:O-succinylbenzoic acid--CoA ligase
MFQLHFRDEIFSSLEHFDKSFEALPDFAQSALTFCQAWLSGEKTFVQQTSGSTGLPKKIELSREQMHASAMATGAFFEVNTETKLLCCLNPEYIAGKMMLVRAMVWNCPIWLVAPEGDPLTRIDFAPDFVAMVPIQVEKSIRSTSSLRKLQEVNAVIIGGAPLSETLKSELVKQHVPAYQTYGMTETVSHITLAKITKETLLYETLPGVNIGQDERGALWTQSPMSGPEKIQTNDLVELKSANSFIWLGRTDFVINSGGVKLHPELLEQKTEILMQQFFPGCRFFFFGEKDEKLGQKLVLVVESEPNPYKSEKLKSALANNLGKFEVPKEIYFIEQFSWTANGKINRFQTFQNL